MSMSMFRKYFATLATHLAGPDSGPEGSSLGREGRGQTCSHSQRAPRSDRTWHRQQHYLTQTTTIPDTNNNITSHRQQLYLNQTTTFPHTDNNLTSHKDQQKLYLTTNNNIPDSDIYNITLSSQPGGSMQIISVKFYTPFPPQPTGNELTWCRRQTSGRAERGNTLRERTSPLMGGFIILKLNLGLLSDKMMMEHSQN